MTITFETVPAGANIIFDTSNALVNTVNCVGVMGAGVAKAFKQRFPEMFAQYKTLCQSGEIRVGAMSAWRTSNGTNQLIVNFPTKKHWRDPSQLIWVEQGLDDLVAGIERSATMAHPITSIAIPPLGCGLGGLDWTVVRPMIVEKLSKITTHDVHVRLYEPMN